MKNRCYMTIHALQTMPASCVNRDDAGSPKEQVYGGKIRARVSSQAWKRAMKMYFEDTGEETGVRTKKIDQYLIGKLIEDGVDEKVAKNLVIEALKFSGLVSDKDDDKDTKNNKGKKNAKGSTSQADDDKDKGPKLVMMYLSQTQIEDVLSLIRKKIADGNHYDKKEMDLYTFNLKKAISDNPTGDMLLFGRMMASDSSLKYDAACQVAHAFSVNEAREEYDYFTAVDELSDSTGAGHIDSKSFNSGVYYRFANVNLSDTSELVRMDKPNAAVWARNFLEGFVRSLPSGSSNSYANTTLPDVVVVEIRDDSPVSYAPAFIDVVKSDNYMKEAEEKLMGYAQETGRKYGEPVVRFTLEDMSFKEMLDKVEETIQEAI